MYVFLCMIMGMVLFAIFHRAVVVIYYILLNANYATYSFGLNEPTLRALDFFTLLLALFFGGWYGTMLGLHWYKLVYEDRDNAGLFHGFVPHHWREPKAERTGSIGSAASTVARPSRPAKIVHTPQINRTSSFDIFKTIKPSAPRAPMSWDLEDIATTTVDETPKRKPRATKARARKPAKARSRKAQAEA